MPKLWTTKVRKTGKILLIFSLVFAWIFSGLAPGFKIKEARAAVSFVGSCENSAIDGADVTLTLPSMLQDDLVIVAYSVGDNDNVDLTMAMVTTGYTKVADLFGNDSQDAHLGVFWKKMGATPDTTATVDTDNLAGTDAATTAVCMVFRGVDTTTPMDVTPTTATGLDTFNPNPPSINHNNPAGVWTVIAGGNVQRVVGGGTYTFPTGYTTNAVDITRNDTNGTTVGAGYNTSPADPEDPGVMTHSGTNDVLYAWAAATLALRPASGAAAPTVATNAATGVTVSAATMNGNITATGGSNSTERGFAWGTNSALSGGDTSTTTESGSFGTGTFSQSLSNILSNRIYYFRAYATNPTGTGYGTIANFTTTTDTTPSRKMRLFEGFTIKFISGRIILHQR